MTVVVDASLVVSALLDEDAVGRWASSVLAVEPLVAPHHMPAEVASILRRASLGGYVSADVVNFAFADLLDLTVDLRPFSGIAERAWELRANVTAYDAWYVALAEALDAPLATLDASLTQAPGTRCEFLLPPGA